MDKVNWDFFFIPILSHAEDVKQFTIINHFTKPLTFLITINPQIVPDLSKEFTINQDAQVTSRVLSSTNSKTEEAYLHAEFNDHQAFFGLAQGADHQVRVYGYIAKGIAYSWDTKKIIFCTQEEYKEKNSCL
jgi:hypothetical protein